MAPLRSPSRLSVDDPFAPDVDDDPLDTHHRHAGKGRPPTSALDWIIERCPWLPTSFVRAGVGLLALVVLVGVSWWFLRPASAPVETTLPMASATTGTVGTGANAGASGTGTAAGPPGAGSTSTTVATDLVVQAAGAVGRPGVYRVAVGARVDDLVRAAGGLLPKADGDRVNLAAPLADGARVWIPAVGETEVPEVVAGGDVAVGGSGGGAAGGAGSGGATATPQVVDLNSATADQLDTLPGVGPSTAAAILAYRSEHGPFASVDDLLEVRGIGDAKLEQIRPLARV
jgi:competence protein ComEA